MRPGQYSQTNAPSRLSNRARANNSPTVCTSLLRATHSLGPVLIRQERHQIERRRALGFGLVEEAVDVVEPPRRSRIEDQPSAGAVVREGFQELADEHSLALSKRTRGNNSPIVRTSLLRATHSSRPP